MNFIGLALWLLSIITLFIGLRLTWRPGEFPALAFLFTYQWVELSTPLWATAITDSSLDDFYATKGNLPLAIFIGYLAILTMAIGLSIGAGSGRRTLAVSLRETAGKYPVRRYYFLCVVALIAATIAEWGAATFPGLSQGFVALAHLKWASFVLLTYVVFRSSGSKFAWILVLMGSIFLGLGEFFSSFKWGLIYGFLGMAAAGVKLSARRIAALSAMVLAALLTGSVWQAIKSDYRMYVSGGTMQQRVVTDFQESLIFIAREASNLSGERLSDGLNDLASRVAVVDMFSAALVNVPDVTPHTNGMFWTAAITHASMPRILFPGKPVLDDSAITRQITGLMVAGVEDSVSISTGYIAEAYADFGKYFMFIPVLITGVGFGFIYRMLIRSKSQAGALVGSALSCVIFVPNASVGISSIKLISGVLILTIVAFSVKRLAKVLLPASSKKPVGKVAGSAQGARQATVGARLHLRGRLATYGDARECETVTNR